MRSYNTHPLCKIVEHYEKNNMAADLGYVQSIMNNQSAGSISKNIS
jgi:hypothetical protein